MSQSLLYHAFGVREGYEYRRTAYLEGRVEFHLSAKLDEASCPQCEGINLWRRGSRERRIASLPIGPKPVVLVVEVPKCECRDCGHVFDVSPPFARAYTRHSRALARFVCELSRLMSLRDVSRLAHLGWDTVKDIVKSDLQARYAQVPLKHVQRIAIDEIYLGSKAKYVTLVLDLDSGRVLWVGPGKGGDALQGFWHELRKAKAKIIAVACDMSAAYWSAVMEYLPEARLIFDKFHIVKLANEATDEVRRGIQRTLDLIGRKAIKGKRYLLLRGRENLKPEQHPSLEEALKWNEPLSQAYYLKEELRELWSQPSHEEASVYLQAWILRAINVGLAPFKRLATTLLRHAKSILNYYHEPITSGKLEGTNNKIGRLTRVAYGYRDSEFLYLRILSLHESTFKLSGV